MAKNRNTNVMPNFIVETEELITRRIEVSARNIEDAINPLKRKIKPATLVIMQDAQKIKNVWPKNSPSAPRLATTLVSHRIVSARELAA